MPDIDVNIDLHPKQFDFLVDGSRYVGASGGYGSGKTYALCAKIMNRARHPGAREGLFRKTRVALTRTTLKTLIEGDGDQPPVLPLGKYTHLKTESEIHIHGGGRIIYGGLDDPKKSGSLNLTGAGIDEAVELTRADYDMVASRCRVKIAGLPNQVYWACNPGPPSHWIAQEYGLAEGAKPARGTRHFTIGTKDNIFLPSDYIESQASLLGEGSIAYRRFFLGEWAGADGLVYDAWNREACVRQYECSMWPRAVLGVDEGYTNPFVCLDIRMSADERVHVASEHYESGMNIEGKRSAIAKMRTKHEAVVIDPSAASLIADIRDRGYAVTPADNAVFDGIMLVQSLLQQGRLTVDPSCENTIREFETYEWKSERDGAMRDEPVKKNDHAMDALRYGLMAMIGRPSKGVQLESVIVGGGDAMDFDDNTGWTQWD